MSGKNEAVVGFIANLLPLYDGERHEGLRCTRSLPEQVTQLRRRMPVGSRCQRLVRVEGCEGADPGRGGAAVNRQAGDSWRMSDVSVVSTGVVLAADFTSCGN